LEKYPLLKSVLEKVPPPEGAKSLGQLKVEFGHIRSVLQKNSGTGVKGILHDYITTPPEGLVQGNDLPSVLSRAHYHLVRNSLQNSISEVETLEGPPALALKPWLDDAKDRLRLELALKVFATFVRVKGTPGTPPGDL